MPGRRAGVTRIIGIDPGSRVTGYGIVDFRGERGAHVASGCVEAAGDALAERLMSIFQGVAELLAAHDPQEMAVEQVFVRRNAASALKLGQARGVAVLAGVSRELPVYEYSATQIKQAVTGRGHGAKVQVQHMVRVLLSLSDPPRADAADALAVALCHGHTRRTLGRMRAAGLGTGLRR